jgi:hypothetical protein
MIKSKKKSLTFPIAVDIFVSNWYKNISLGQAYYSINSFVIIKV